MRARVGLRGLRQVPASESEGPSFLMQPSLRFITCSANSEDVSP